MLAGPSGVGKGTVLERLFADDPSLWLSVSATTRPPRSGEVDGVNYRFMSRSDFEALRDAGGFLESFEVYGHLYGTPRAPVEDRLATGSDVVLEVDVQGALAVRDQIPDALTVFVRAPSREVQARRLRDRGQDSETEIERRLAEAAAEEALAHRFDEVLVNDDADRVAVELGAILGTRRSARSR